MRSKLKASSLCNFTYFIFSFTFPLYSSLSSLFIVSPPKFVLNICQQSISTLVLALEWVDYKQMTNYFITKKSNHDVCQTNIHVFNECHSFCFRKFFVQCSCKNREIWKCVFLSFLIYLSWKTFFYWSTILSTCAPTARQIFTWHIRSKQ